MPSTSKPVVVVPNWNGEAELGACLDSLQAQSLKPHIIVVDNGSVDGSLELLNTQYPTVELIKHRVNKGYAGGVNPGFRRAFEMNATYVAPFNNDAVADKDWLKHLVYYLDHHPDVGIAACKLLSIDGSFLDSTGEAYTNWGLPYPRGRGETDTGQYDHQMAIFGASGGASLYRVGMLREVGLLDENFFAYYEDVDLSFRAQLTGWKVAFVPLSKTYHRISATSSRIKGFGTYQTMKNLPWLLLKNVPSKFLWRVGVRFGVAYSLFMLSAIARGNGWPAVKGCFTAWWGLPRVMSQRRQIQAGRTVSDEYIWNLMAHDLPPQAIKLQKARRRWWELTGKASR